MIEITKTRILIRRIVIFTVLLLSSNTSIAKTNWYKVELIVFAHLNDSAISEEVWMDDPGLPSLEKTTTPELRRGSINLSEPVAYSLLRKNQLTLNKEFLYMKRSRYYRPLLHTGWFQPGLSKNESSKLYIVSGLDNYLYKPGNKQPSRTDSRFNLPILEGTIKVYLETYLHADVDLLYRKTQSQPVLEDELNESIQPTQFRLTEKRKMRLEELHYLDHPLFGVLIQITRAVEKSDTPLEKP